MELDVYTWLAPDVAEQQFLQGAVRPFPLAGPSSAVSALTQGCRVQVLHGTGALRPDASGLSYPGCWWGG